jgi:hypothetical protein
METDFSRPKLASVLAISEPPASRARTMEDEPSIDNRTRKRRAANVPTYNLKTLSAIQHRRSPQKPKPRDLRSTLGQEKPDDDTILVTYALSKVTKVPKQETTVVGYTCVFCANSHSSLNDLAFHLRMTHDSWKFTLRRSNTQRAAFFLKLAKQGSSIPMLEQSRTFQLSLPRTQFDLEKFINGDESWTKARKGPLHDYLPERLQEQFSSSSSSPYESRQSSPNTSCHTDDDPEPQKYIPKMAIRSRKIFYVPNSNKPLFDTVTKQVLVPGAEISNSDEETDENWLHQKHRDVIMDFTDVTAEEKDYIVHWNSFIMKQQLTCETYLPDAVLEFVDTNKFWFEQKKYRKRELAKTLESFIMRGVVTEECFDKCIDILKEAEKVGGSKGKEPMEEDRPVSPSKQRGALDCECGKHTKPPDRVICRGRVSSYIKPYLVGVY